MLRWRLFLGILLTAALAGLCWLDYHAQAAGIWLLPIAITVVILGTQEMLDFVGAAGLHPVAAAVYAGNLLVLAANWFPLIFPHGLADRAIPCRKSRGTDSPRAPACARPRVGATTKW